MSSKTDETYGPQSYENKRTLGDGMDTIDLNQSLERAPAYNEIKSTMKPSRKMLLSIKPVEATKKIILVPKYVPNQNKKPKSLIQKPKEPKFIPYEPYKAAVFPIQQKHKVHPLKIRSKNNVEINTLVEQMSEIRKSELSKLNSESDSNKVISKQEWEDEKRKYELDIKNLRGNNVLLENQLKMQVQVNNELKTLLVAAVGEDLESRVQHLTEDKLQLARALLTSANNLHSNQEETEWLSGQCEVWRSKFLASSLMVEELAKWKSALTNRVNETQNILRKLLEERSKVQQISLQTNCALRSFTNNQNIEHIKNANVVNLASDNFELIKDVKNVNDEEMSEMLSKFVRLPRQTASEQAALKLLQNPVNISNKQDAIFNALRGVAIHSQEHDFYSNFPAHNCRHCTGIVKNV